MAASLESCDLVIALGCLFHAICKWNGLLLYFFPFYFCSIAESRKKNEESRFGLKKKLLFDEAALVSFQVVGLPIGVDCCSFFKPPKKRDLEIPRLVLRKLCRPITVLFVVVAVGHVTGLGALFRRTVRNTAVRYLAALAQHSR